MIKDTYKDCLDFIEDHCVIKSKDENGKDINIKLNEIQKLFIKMFEENPNMHVPIRSQHYRTQKNVNIHKSPHIQNGK